MRRACRIAFVASAPWLLAVLLTAQAQPQLHDSQYPDADIAYGLSVYSARCAVCHGAQGDAARGRAIVEGKGTCLTCHRVGRVGSRVAPNLTSIGSNRSAGSLQRSLVNPTSQMMPINRPVRLVTSDGTVVTGRRLNEDTYSVQLIDDRERLRSFIKSDLKELTVATTSPMPSYERTLTGDEIADVIAYLLSLKAQ